MRVLSFVNQKGGAGKTSLAVSVAVAAAEGGEKVVALDLDQQGSLYAWGMDRPDELEMPMVDQITADRLPRLASILSALEAKGISLVILDLPGVHSSSLNEAIRMTTLCCIPCQPSRFDVRAAKPTVQLLLANDKDFTFILNRCAPQGSRGLDAQAVLSVMGHVAPVLITQRTDHLDAIATGRGVTEFNPKGRAAAEIRELWQFLDRRMAVEPAKPMLKVAV